MEPAKKFLLTFVIVVLVVCSVIAAINIYANPYGYYRDTQLGNGNVFNAQIAKLQYIENMKEKPDAFVLGSSNSMRMPPKTIDSLFGCKSYNYGVFQANVYDFHCICHALVDDLRINPKLIIFCLDDWNFSKDKHPPDEVFYGAQNRLAYKPRLSQYLNDYSGVKLFWARLKSAISYEQLTLSYANLMMAYKKKDFTQNVTPISGTFFPDGTRIHYGDMDGNDVSAIAEAGTYKLTDYLKQKNDSLLKINNVGILFDAHEDFEEFDARSLDLFDSLIGMLNRKGTKIVFNIMPIQPYYQQLLMASKKSNYAKRIAMLYDFLITLKEKYKNVLVVKDNHLVNSFNGKPDAFFDYMHPTSYNSNLMLYSIYKELK